MDGQSVRERATLLTGCQMKIICQQASCLPVSFTQRYYLWMPELFMHCKITLSGSKWNRCRRLWWLPYYCHYICWSLSCSWQRKRDKPCQRFTLNCNFVSLVIVIIRLQNCGYIVLSSHINGNKIILLLWFLGNHSPLVFSPFRANQAWASCWLILF